MIGTPGAAIYKPVLDALLAWEGQYGVVGKVTKGSNLYTEHYSAVKADVEDHTDPTTKINKTLIDLLKEYDEILVGGEAAGHCVANTIYDVAEEFGDDECKKITILSDCTSPVPGFDFLVTKFNDFCNAKGIKQIKSTEYSFN